MYLDVEKFRDDVYAITELLSSRLEEKDKPKLNHKINKHYEHLTKQNL